MCHDPQIFLKCKLYPLVCKHAKIIMQRWYGQGSPITSGLDAYMCDPICEVARCAGVPRKHKLISRIKPGMDRTNS